MLAPGEKEKQFTKSFHSVIGWFFIHKHISERNRQVAALNFDFSDLNFGVEDFRG